MKHGATSKSVKAREGAVQAVRFREIDPHYVRKNAGRMADLYAQWDEEEAATKAKKEGETP